ncbi:MAG: hypothetical protein ACK2TZ_11105, partial [Anaerolineales bacterium]
MSAPSYRRVILVLVATLLGVFLASVFIGRYPEPYWMPIDLEFYEWEGTAKHKVVDDGQMGHLFRCRPPDLVGRSFETLHKG